jgi:3-oxoacyl-[acyl-carrier protein] reductase
MTQVGITDIAQFITYDLEGRNITVNTIQPRPVDTDMNPANAGWS